MKAHSAIVQEEEVKMLGQSGIVQNQGALMRNH